MKLTLLLALLAMLGAHQANAASNLVCYYDSASFLREGASHYSLAQLEVALQFCTHVIYGYAGIQPGTSQVVSLNENLEIQRRHFAMVTALKERYPLVKFLLSVGGDRDLQNPEKYMELLEGGQEKHAAFVQSARNLIRSYNFDGLDLAFQFPRNKPRKVHSDIGSIWKSFKKLFTGDYIVDEKSDEHKEQFTSLIAAIKNNFRQDDLMLTLTVLPNVNSSWYFNVPAIIPHLDMVTLGAFDFLTPERNPEEADYTAPLYEPILQDRLPHYNVDFQVDHWLAQRAPYEKIHIGVPAYGRAWKMTADSQSDGRPIVKATDGPAPAGPLTKTPGLLNWVEICAMLPNAGNIQNRGATAPIRRVTDPTKRYGTYAFRAADADGEHGMWVSYDDPDVAASKAGYAKSRNLGGISLFDLSMDDFNGQCTGDKYPMLRAIKYRLL